jgi:peptidoglycan/xylan/chitin deacetylase (PgdA/CDA1 family)
MSRIALTFDDGPSIWTGPILDVLAAHSAHATFFVIGRRAEESPDVVHRIAAEGHEIGNHTWSHPWLARDCDDERVDAELRRTNSLLDSLLGAPPRRFRAPHYDVDERVEAVASRLGLVHTHGDVTPPDWHERSTAALIATLILRQVSPGGVVGLHDGIPPGRSGSRQATVDAVSTIVPRLRARGLELVTASALLTPG